MAQGKEIENGPGMAKEREKGEVETKKIVPGDSKGRWSANR